MQCSRVQILCGESTTYIFVTHINTHSRVVIYIYVVVLFSVKRLYCKSKHELVDINKMDTAIPPEINGSYSLPQKICTDLKISTLNIREGRIMSE